MKRRDIVDKLISEGFTEKFLSRLSDKNLRDLSERILSEATYKVPVEKLDQVKSKVSDDDTIEVAEEEECDECNEVDEQEEINEWVDNLVQTNYHPEITTKKEIYEMIGSLSDSADALVSAQKMFDVDEQQEDPSRPHREPTTIPKPGTRPGKPKRENPFEPKHKPKPKAVLPKQLTFDSLGIKLSDGDDQ